MWYVGKTIYLKLLSTKQKNPVKNTAISNLHVLYKKTLQCSSKYGMLSLVIRLNIWNFQRE